MPTTSNFGWTTPADTDLVKDGAAAIRTLGNGIDTSFLDLKGGTTDQVLAKNSNTDLDFKWVAQDDSNAIQNAIVDAKGDLISATAADTPARLAVGANGTVLTADSAESTGLKWATPAAGGGWTQIGSTITLNGASNYTINTTTGYRNWVIELDDPYGVSGDINPYIFFNGDTTVANYRGCVVRTIASGFQSAAIDTATVFYFSLNPASTNDSYCQIQVFDPDATTHRKGYQCNSVITESGSAPQVSTVMFQWENAAAITSVRVQTDTGVNFAGGTFKIWGLK